ncbi:MAG: NUDIX domain-containing protein [Bacteroidales bacterium]
MTEVKFYDPSFIPDTVLTFSVIAAKYGDKWIFVRHLKRNTWEIPGGHIEKNETADEAAQRELNEETGAVDFSIECVATYSVQKEGKLGYGRLYLADISKLGPVPDSSEIGEITIAASLPENLTYPDIQPHLFRKAVAWFDKKHSDI